MEGETVSVTGRKKEIKLSYVCRMHGSSFLLSSLPTQKDCCKVDISLPEMCILNINQLKSKTSILFLVQFLPPTNSPWAEVSGDTLSSL